MANDTVPLYGSADKSQKPRFFYGYIVVLCGFIVMLVILGIQYSFGIFFTPLIQEFGWSRASTSLAFSIAQTSAGIMGIFTGRLSDKIGPQLVLAGCGVILGAGCILMSITQELWQYYLFMGLCLGLGLSGSFSPVLSAVSRWFERRRGLMTGIVVSGIGFGTILFPILVTALLKTYTWRMSFIILGIIALVFIIGSGIFIKRDPQSMGLTAYGSQNSGTASASMTSGLSFRQAARTPVFWMICGIFVLQGYFVLGVMTHIVPNAIHLGIDASSAAAIISFLGIGSITGRVVMSGVADRLSVRNSLLINQGILILSLLWLLISGKTWMFFLFAVVFGFGYGGMVGLQALLVADFFGLASLGTLLGFVTCSVSVGGMLGPFLSGYIFDMTNSYQVAFIVFAVLAVLGLILGLMVKHTEKEKAYGFISKKS